MLLIEEITERMQMEKENYPQQKIVDVLQADPEQSFNFTELLAALGRRRNSSPVGLALWMLVSDKVVKVTNDRRFMMNDEKYPIMPTKAE